MIEQKLKNMVIWTTSIQCKMRKKNGFLPWMLLKLKANVSNPKSETIEQIWSWRYGRDLEVEEKGEVDRCWEECTFFCKKLELICWKRV
jgi:hypothetical protein